jgi:outer membrane protein assembly factor BamD
MSGRLAHMIVLAVALIAAGCASRGRGTVPPGTLQPDRFLFERGNEELARKRWLIAREFFKQVTETYTQSPIRPDAKLGVGDTYLGEGSADALVLALAEFQEFLSFYPTHPRADYAQYKLGMTHHKQMRSPQRDQTETRDAIREFNTFIARYPNSALMPEVRARLREARDRLSTAELEIGVFYYKIRWYPGAADRLSAIIREDPEFTSRDAVYFYLGETYIKIGQPAAALPMFEKLVSEFERSEHLEDARERIETLKNPPAPSATATKSAAR